MYDLERIKQDNPLSEIVMQEAGEPSRKGRWLFWRCPLPGHDDRTPSFGVDEKERFVCFGSCNQEGDLFDYLQLTRGWDLQRSVEYFGGVELSEEEKLQQDLDRVKRQQERTAKEIERIETALEELRQGRAWEKYEATLTQLPEYQTMWCEAGLPIIWQEIYHVGAAPDFYEGPSLTMTVRTPWQELPVNIRHRIIGRTDDKYRPERPGLPPSFYWAFPQMGPTPNTFLVEGEKKAMVLGRYLSEAGLNDTQVVGIMGKNGLRPELAKQLSNVDHIYYIPDPDVKRETIWQHIQTIGITTTIMNLPMKSDDMLVAGLITPGEVLELTHTSKTVKV